MNLKYVFLYLKQIMLISARVLKAVMMIFLVSQGILMKSQMPKPFFKINIII